MRVTIVTLDNHLTGAVGRVRSQLAREAPGLELTVHAASNWAASPDSLKACIEDIGQANIVIATISVGTRPFGVAVNPAGTRAYVSNSNAAPLGPDTVSVINTATNTVVATIVVGDSPDGLALTPDGDFLYVTSTSDDTIWVINTATNTVTDTFAVGDRPTEIAVGYV
jgi:YVTN family beta-propeller protein